MSLHRTAEPTEAEVIDLPRVPVFISRQTSGVKRLVADSLVRLIERRDSDDATLLDIDRDERGIVQLIRDFGLDTRPESAILADCNLVAALLSEHRTVAGWLALDLLGGLA